MKGVGFIDDFLPKYNPTNDYIFKRLFGHPGNEDITLNLINSILDNKIYSLSLDNNTFLEKDVIGDKVGILDIRATLNNKFPCDIEMQVTRADNIEERILFYWSKLYASSISSGDAYSQLPKTIVILIADFEIDKLNSLPLFHTKWQIREAEFPKFVLTERLELHIIEIPKLERLMKENVAILNKDLVSWIKFIKNPKLLEVSDMENKEIKKANEELDKILSDEKERYLADLRFKYLSDRATMIETGIREGREQGLKEGKKEGKKEGAKLKTIEIEKKMLKDKKDLDEIMKYTGLTADEIKKL